MKPRANGTNGSGYSMGPKQIVLSGQLIGHKRILNVENDSDKLLFQKKIFPNKK